MGPSPLSLSARLLFGRQLDPGVPGVGVFYLEGLAGYQASDRLAVNGGVKLAAFGNTEIAGLGIGANFELFEGMQLIAEAHAVGLDADTATWAAGVRYDPAGLPISVDLGASNAIGRHGIGTLVAQDETRYSLGVSTRFSLR